jgi:hypothetical protein
MHTSLCFVIQAPIIGAGVSGHRTGLDMCLMLGGRMVGYTEELDMRLVDTLQNSRADLNQVGMVVA